MQPVDDVETTKAAKSLLNSSECMFDISKDSARLCPVQFGSRA